MPPKPPEETKWKPGQSGNPNGRPKGLARKVQELVPPERLVEFHVDVMNGNSTEIGEKPTLKDRLAAAAWLADRGWAKAPTHAPIEEGDPLGLAEIDGAIDTLVDELASRREAKTPRPSTNGAVEANSKAGAAPA